MDKKSLNTYSLNANTFSDFREGAESSTLDSFVQLSSGIVRTPVLFRSSTAVLDGQSINRFIINGTTTLQALAEVFGAGNAITAAFQQYADGNVKIEGIGSTTEAIVSSGAAALFVTGVGGNQVNIGSFADATVIIDGAGASTTTIIQEAAGDVEIHGGSSEIVSDVLQIASGIVGTEVIYGVGSSTTAQIVSNGAGAVSDRNLWDTNQGVAKGYAKFTPTLDAEPFAEEHICHSGFTVVKPITEARAPVIYAKVNSSIQYVFSARANGYASVEVKPSTVTYYCPNPEATSRTSTYMFRIDNRHAAVVPKSEAKPVINLNAVMTANGFTVPWGVKNPSDEELILVIMQARRQRHLTSVNTDGIRH